MLFAFVFICNGTAFYVHQSEDGYSAFVLNEWIVADDVDGIIEEISRHCYELIQLANQG